MGFIVRPNGKKWKLMLREGGKEKYLRQEAYPPGIVPTMSLAEARQAASRLNGDGRTRLASISQARAQARWQQQAASLSNFFPADLVSSFERSLYTRHGAIASRLVTQWRAAMPLLRMGAVGFHSALRAKGYSPDYADRLIVVANMWLAYSHQPERIDALKGMERKRLHEAFYKRGVDRAASPLTPESLNMLKQHLAPEQYNFMFVSLWLGARPSEISRQEIELQELSPTQQWLRVYQEKLISLPPQKRWKAIPLLNEEMKLAARLWLAGGLRPPLVKTLRKYLKDPKAGLYSGRKGFTPLMQSLGYELLDISLWLGHQTVDRTLKNYRDRDKLFWPKKAS